MKKWIIIILAVDAGLLVPMLMHSNGNISVEGTAKL